MWKETKKQKGEKGTSSAGYLEREKEVGVLIDIWKSPDCHSA